MISYYCAHCGTDLGKLDEGEPQLVCPFHPDGVVTAYQGEDNGNSQPE